MGYQGYTRLNDDHLLEDLLDIAVEATRDRDDNGYSQGYADALSAVERHLSPITAMLPSGIQAEVVEALRKAREGK